MAGSMTEIPVNGDAVPAYISCPLRARGRVSWSSRSGGGLVPHIRDVADRMAAQGFVALAPDLHGARRPLSPTEAGKLVMEMQLDQAARTWRPRSTPCWPCPRPPARASGWSASASGRAGPVH